MCLSVLVRELKARRTRSAELQVTAATQARRTGKLNLSALYCHVVNCFLNKCVLRLARRRDIYFNFRRLGAGRTHELNRTESMD